MTISAVCAAISGVGGIPSTSNESNNAPMMMVDHEFHEYLTPEKVDKVLDELK